MYRQDIMWLLTRKGRTVEKNGRSMAEMIVNTIRIAMVVMIGPMAFSTNDDSKKAIEETVIIDIQAMP
jgi:hypothetical protein